MINDKNLKITVGITTYNRPGFLKEAVCSVLQQSYKNFEILLSNDYIDVPVTFESLEIEEDSRIKIINQVSNLGEINNMNYLLHTAQGEWFVWLADDDLMHSDFLQIAVSSIHEFQDRNPIAFFSNYSSGDSPDRLFPKPIKKKQCTCDNASLFVTDYTSLKKRLIGCYGLIHKETLKKIGGRISLGNSFGPYNDTLIPILLIEYGSICWLDEELIFLRTHAGSLSCKSSDFSAYSSAEDDFLDHLILVCQNEKLNLNQNELIANMIRWFSKNEWKVLSRNTLFSSVAVINKFIHYQIFVNLPRLSFKHKINHILFVSNMMSRILLYRILKNYR